ncbi:MAG: hypothetical protein ACYT04_38610 [Nostoc sp.]
MKLTKRTQESGARILQLNSGRLVDESKFEAPDFNRGKEKILYISAIFAAGTASAKLLKIAISHSLSRVGTFAKHCKISRRKSRSMPLSFHN